VVVRVVVVPGSVVVPPSAVTTLVSVSVLVTVRKFGSTNVTVRVTRA
jgi:hypothetical protein